MAAVPHLKDGYSSGFVATTKGLLSQKTAVVRALRPRSLLLFHRASPPSAFSSSLSERERTSNKYIFVSPSFLCVTNAQSWSLAPRVASLSFFLFLWHFFIWTLAHEVFQKARQHISGRILTNAYRDLSNKIFSRFCISLNCFNNVFAKKKNVYAVTIVSWKILAVLNL